ncbi:hypothetical protein SAMN02799630_05119 [Paenibacillus sp. UNCCL117]|uniref:DUF1284 domain-containing protein n=1 Tax=unclassified Paenibacillus TaxID=185978 RepID=UPI0008842875|nr:MULTISPECIES: DUF1284 domain-containing protein [unclassified Paenibacillus]SDE29452.1 hypothetical protein SAMN04488602_12438 [Paenibacillus sp. cl123]SFW63270.1 hypothetical protein SAMN02799630_05119 [Paenibacillus sp. UNCCL117]
MIKLRGHHLLCLLGYRGMGYSDDFCVNMTAIYERLRIDPETMIVMVEGPDDICEHYPQDRPVHCREAGVGRRDALVLEKLGLKLAEPVVWSQVLAEVAACIEPDDIRVICSSCPWEQYGVCREGVEMVGRGESLPQVADRERGR